MTVERKINIGSIVAVLTTALCFAFYLGRLQERVARLEKGGAEEAIQKELLDAMKAIEGKLGQALGQLRRDTEAHAKRLSSVKPPPVGTASVCGPKWMAQGEVVGAVSDQISVKAVEVSELTRSATFEIEIPEHKRIRCSSMNVGESKLFTYDDARYIFSFLRVRRSSKPTGKPDEAEICIVRRL